MNVDRTTEGTPTIAAGVLTAVCTTWVVVALRHPTSLTDETRPMWVVIHIAQLVFAPILFTAAAGPRVNSANRYVEWRVVLALAVTGMAAAPLAALAAQEIPAQTLGRLFAVWLLSSPPEPCGRRDRRRSERLPRFRSQPSTPIGATIDSEGGSRAFDASL